MSEKNNVAIVTGGTRGIGKEISLHLSKAGYKVIAIYAKDEKNANEFEKTTGITVKKCDVSDFQSCKQTAEEIETKIGIIDVLVNNAGIIRDSMMHKMTEEYWLTVVQNNLTSCFNFSRSIIGEMRKRNYGRIISISSINAVAGQMGQTNYSAAKAGIIGFTKALALESASKGITVNAIAPGYIKTDMTNNIKKEILDLIVSRIPVGRMGEPSEIARTVLFLANRDSGFITGSTMHINGGQHML